jgi:hypothetical protein
MRTKRKFVRSLNFVRIWVTLTRQGQGVLPCYGFPVPHGFLGLFSIKTVVTVTLQPQQPKISVPFQVLHSGEE